MVKYRALHNLVQRTSKKLRHQYYSRRVDSLRRAGPRKWWGEVKRLSGQPRTCPIQTLAANMCDCNKPELVNKINHSFYCVSADLDPLSGSSTYHSRRIPDEFVIEPHQVYRKLTSIDTYKSLGPDDIPNWVWSHFAAWLSEPICAIFNVSLRSGMVPGAWKLANVTPIPKVTPPTQIDRDHRPISVTPTVSKVLE